MAKKLARMDVQSTLRSEVTLESSCTPAMSKRSVSPSLRFKVVAMPSSMLMAPASSGVHAPPTTWLLSGRVALWLRLNSRSTRRRARSSV